MSKPDPKITANLLHSVLGSTEAKPGNTPGLPGRKGRPETQPANPTPKPPPLRSAKNAATGQGHMRSSNRGK